MASVVARTSDLSARYREILARATDAVGVIGPDGTYAEQNDAHRALIGYPDSELLGRTPEIHLGKEGFARVLAALAEKGEFHGELKSRRRDGSEVDVELVAFTLRDEEGRVTCHVGIKRDVTERRSAERALKKEVERLRIVHDLGATVSRATSAEAIMHAALASVEAGLAADRAAILLYDAYGVMRFRAWAGLSDDYRAAVEGHSPWARDAPDPQPVLVPDVETADLGPLRDIVLREGIRACAFVPLVHQGRLLGKFMAYYERPHAFVDEEIRLATTLAQHVAFAVARKESERELESSRRNLEDFVETSAIGLHWVGPDGTVLWANRADHESLGYSEAEYVGRDIRSFHADPEVIGDILARLTRGERIMGYPAQLRAKDGSIRHVLIDSSVLWEEGKFVHTRCFTRDVTEQKLAEMELVATRRQLALNEKMSALGTLVSGVAHEIRTPLTYVSNNAHLAREAVARGDTERALLRLEECVEGVDRINRLVASLRRFTRDVAGEKRPEDPVAIVSEAVELFRATHRGRVAVALDAHPMPPLALERIQVQQVVLNLLENAAEAATPAGGHVQVRVEDRGDRVEVVVMDDGPGVPPEVQARMFEPFYTTKADGTGLGLSIVRRIVEGHGGTIRCDSAPGKGTVFTTTLPRDAA